MSTSGLDSRRYSKSNQPNISDGATARLAATQWGVVARRQLLALGLSASAIDRRVWSGRLHVIHRGVYAVGHPVLPQEGRWIAAVLAAGRGAVLSHHAAAALWELRATERLKVDVTTAARGRSGAAGINLHRVRRLDREDIAVRRGIPTTTVARTLVDLAGALTPRQVERTLDEAAVRRLDTGAVHGAVGRAPTRRGVGKLETLIAAGRAGATFTGSELEERFIELCRRAGVPEPLVNHRLTPGGRRIEVDFYWPAAALVVEVDGLAAHGTTRAFERDRARDADLVACGLRVVRFTWARVTRDGPAVTATLWTLLRGSAGAGG